MNVQERPLNLTKAQLDELEQYDPEIRRTIGCRMSWNTHRDGDHCGHHCDLPYGHPGGHECAHYRMETTATGDTVIHTKEAPHGA